MMNILPGIDSKVMPLRLLQLVRSPFFDIFTVVPSDHVLGIALSSHIFLKSAYNIAVAVTVIGTNLNSSAVSWSFHGALLFLRLLMASSIYSFDGTSVHIIFLSISSTISGMSTVVSGLGLLSTSLKCAIYLCFCTFSYVSNAPCLSFTGAFTFLPYHTISSLSDTLLACAQLSCCLLCVLYQSLGVILFVLP